MSTIDSTSPRMSSRAGACVVRFERGMQLRDLAPVGLRDVGVQPRRRRDRGLQLDASKNLAIVLIL
jgi:hypothetical protein